MVWSQCVLVSSATSWKACRRTTVLLSHLMSSSRWSLILFVFSESPCERDSTCALQSPCCLSDDLNRVESPVPRVKRRAEGRYIFVPLFTSFSPSITVVSVVRIPVIIKWMTLLEKKWCENTLICKVLLLNFLKLDEVTMFRGGVWY